MNPTRLALLLLLTSLPLIGATSADTAPASTVIVENENRELAAGYALAFTKLRRVPFHVQIQHENGKPLLIQDVKTVSAAGSALLIETNKGLFYVVNPKDVVWISDSPVEKPAGSEAK